MGFFFRIFFLELNVTQCTFNAKLIDAKNACANSLKSEMTKIGEYFSSKLAFSASDQWQVK